MPAGEQMASPFGALPHRSNFVCYFILLPYNGIYRSVDPTEPSIRRYSHPLSLRNHGLISAYPPTGKVRLTHPLDHAYMVQTNRSLLAKYHRPTQQKLNCESKVSADR